MPLTLRRGTVSAVVERHEGLVRLEVDGVPCVAYPELTGPVALGDDVVVNVQARELALGSGGFDVLHTNLTRGLDLRPERDAHVMKLPYTPIQFATRHGEEDVELPRELGEMPVVVCSLHSQVAPVCAALRGVRVTYVQVPGGALPVRLSDALRLLKDRGLVESTIGVGSCFGGDVDSVNLYSALALARARGTDVAVCSIGPGIVGTATELGHGAMAAASALYAALVMSARGVFAVRVSEHDPRERHRGVSHHANAVLSQWTGTYEVPWPKGCPVERPLAGDKLTEIDVGGWQDACGDLPLSHMGRGPDEDPWFFAAAFAAGKLARGLVT